jgi:signal transduction histidine kinase
VPLSRLRTHTKIALVAAVPLVFVAVLSGLFVRGAIQRADQASRIVATVSTASRVGVIIADLQQERLVSVGALRGVASPTTVALQRATVDDRIADLKSSLGAQMPPALRAALDSVASLDPLRAQIATRAAAPADVLGQFHQRIAGVLDAMPLIDGVDAGTRAGREVVALDSLMRVDELRTGNAAALVATAGIDDPAAIVAYAANQAAIPALASRFTQYATPAQVAGYRLVDDAYDARVGQGFANAFAADPTSAVRGLSAAEIYPRLTSFVQLARSVEGNIATDVTDAMSAQRNRDLMAAYVAGAVAILVLLIGIGLAVAAARSTRRSLRALTSMAERVRAQTDQELRRMAREEAEPAHEPRFEPVDIGARGEFRPLANAFTQVQQSAVALVGRQAQSRRNMAQMYGHMGRRAQTLVGRQLAIVDGLALDEPDADRLRELFRLDHVTSRLRRNASSLVVLSGAADESTYFAPLPLADVIGRALGEIEDDSRVDIDVPVATSVRPAIINDLVLILAELIENATTFSPPHTRVLVAAEPGSATVSVIDEGIGMAPEQLARENARMAERERLDLAPTEALGFFLVARLARRHGIGVRLEETPGGGVTVALDLRGYALQTGRTEAARPPVRSRGPVMVPAGAPGAGRPLSWPEPMALASVPFDLATLERANRVLESAAPWNAFEVQPELGAPAHAGRDGRPGNGHEETATIALVRRIPGATVAPEALAASGPAVRPPDPKEARDLVEQIEFGVAQALREVARAGEGEGGGDGTRHRDVEDTP